MLTFLAVLFAAVWGVIGFTLSALAVAAFVGIAGVLLIPFLLVFGLFRLMFGLLQVAMAVFLIGAVAIFLF
jgi:hypothetical protein